MSRKYFTVQTIKSTPMIVLQFCCSQLIIPMNDLIDTYLLGSDYWLFEYVQGYFYLIKKNQKSKQIKYSHQMQDDFTISKLKKGQQLKITDQPLPTVLHKSYSNTSQVNDLMHQPFQSSRAPNYHLTNSQNPITQQSVIRQVPENNQIETYSKGKIDRVATEHQNWLQVNKKFSKPYSECTKYIDNLSQHKALIRRGPFDVPLAKDSLVNRESTYDVKNSRNDTDKSSRQYSLTNNLSRIKSSSYSVNDHDSQYQYKSIFRTKKDMIFKSLNNLKDLHDQSINKPRASKSINLFDRSLKNTANNYELLMKQQRNLKVDNVLLKNSANKLIAMDLIKQKLQENSLSAKNNLKKIQQKFKKRPDIRVRGEDR